MDTQEQIIYNQLKDILLTVKPKIDQSLLTEDAHLINDIGMDSLSMLLLMLAIESEYGIKIPGNSNFLTVKETVRYIKEHTA